MKQTKSRRDFFKAAAATAAAMAFPWASSCSKPANGNSKPNFIIIFCDDLGYGDLGIFGHPTIKTPNLDQMAREGQKWTNFYVAASVCTPSRAGLMTGRYPVRSGMCSEKRRVLFPDSAGGLPQSEITIAEALKTVGYKTACIGKWHLGHLPQYLPTKHGFDSYFGIPYSNDMDKIKAMSIEAQQSPKSEYYNVPLMRNEDIIERPANQNTITKRYTEEAINFIKQNKNELFFLYFPHSMPHIPLFASDDFINTSRRGLFGDVIEEIDWSVGEILETLRKEGLTENTMVVFTSDNGPWLLFGDHGGSAGLLRDGKGTTWEGGMREPTIFWWLGKIKPDVKMGMGSTLDLLPTLCSLAGAEIPNDRELDGFDLTPALLDNARSPRNLMIYYRRQTIFAARKGAYKAHFITRTAYSGSDEKDLHHETPLLFNVEVDPSEKYNIADKHPDIIDDIIKEVEKHKATVKPVKDQLADRIDDVKVN